MPENELLEVVDTSRILTADELRELKKIAQASRILKWTISFVVGILGVITAIFELFNVDKLPWHK